MPAPDERQGSLQGPDRERSVARDTAADVAEVLREVTQPFVDDAVGSVSFMLLAVLLVPVGIVIVSVGLVAMAVTFRALGSPTGLLASVITIAWLLGMLVALIFAFRALHRRMPRRLREAYAGQKRAPSTSQAQASRRGGFEVASSEGAPAHGTPSGRAPTLAELDARLAPPAGPPDPT